MKYLFIILLALVVVPRNSFGQPVPKGTEIQELVWVSEVYAHIPNLCFSMKYTYADSLYPATILDSTLLNCKLSKGKSFSSNSEVEYLQGREFNIYVNKEDSFVMVSPALDYKSFFKAPLLDSTFRKGHVKEMSTWTINDSTRKFCVNFRPESYYVNYTMVYNSKTGLVKSISFCTKNPYGMYGLATDHILKTTMTMTGYSTTPVEAVLFNENRYVYRLNGQLYLQSAWTGYHLQQ
jgi:hypothetical protein